MRAIFMFALVSIIIITGILYSNHQDYKDFKEA